MLEAAPVAIGTPPACVLEASGTVAMLEGCSPAAGAEAGYDGGAEAGYELDSGAGAAPVG